MGRYEGKIAVYSIKKMLICNFNCYFSLSAVIYVVLDAFDFLCKKLSLGNILRSLLNLTSIQTWKTRSI